VLVFWCGCRHAWLTILVYHLQVLFWSGGNLAAARRGWNARAFAVGALPALAAGPLLYALLPVMAPPDQLRAWLAAFGLTRTAWVVMIPYFGLVHPFLEQVHWSPLRRDGWSAHLAFAGYHALVLYSLLPVPWLLLCLAVLVAVSALWARLESASGLLVPLCGHVFADLGIVLAAWFAMR
jgi:hypothetical protein